MENYKFIVKIKLKIRWQQAVAIIIFMNILPLLIDIAINMITNRLVNFYFYLSTKIAVVPIIFIKMSIIYHCYMIFLILWRGLLHRIADDDLNYSIHNHAQILAEKNI